MPCPFLVLGVLFKLYDAKESNLRAQRVPSWHPSESVLTPRPPKCGESPRKAVHSSNAAHIYIYICTSIYIYIYVCLLQSINICVRDCIYIYICDVRHAHIMSNV